MTSSEIVEATWKHFTGKVQCLQCGIFYPPVPKGSTPMNCGSCGPQPAVVRDPGEYDGYAQPGLLAVRPGVGDRVWVQAWHTSGLPGSADRHICKPGKLNDVREKCVGLGPGGPNSRGYWSDAYCVRTDDDYEIEGERFDPKTPMYPVFGGGELIPLAIVPTWDRRIERLVRPFKYAKAWLERTRYYLTHGRMP